MSTPLALKATFTLTANTTQKTCNLSTTLPDTAYSVSADFPFNTGGWWIDTKTATSFKIYTVNSDVANKDFTIYIYWDDSNFQA